MALGSFCRSTAGGDFLSGREPSADLQHIGELRAGRASFVDFLRGPDTAGHQRVEADRNRLRRQ